MSSKLFLLLVVLSVLSFASGFANYLTHHYCDAPIANSEMMMGQNLMLSFARNITLFRNEQELKSNIVKSLDGLFIALAPKSPQSVLEIRSEGVEFKDGSCTKKHRIIKQGELVLTKPDSVTYPLEIQIVAAWARSYESGVKYTEPFTIIYDPNATATANAEL